MNNYAENSWVEHLKKITEENAPEFQKYLFNLNYPTTNFLLEQAIYSDNELVLKLFKYHIKILNTEKIKYFNRVIRKFGTNKSFNIINESNEI